ncbi:hypothetical protein ACK3SF_01810 [Candidatus Nanosalina sp. VS9-1]|uniref:hypothetical protein n=1 Tax=Candidatus Nanosalina sp. VS9-1 TaxID=3388566 RepID=UPI0039E1B0C6
MDIYLAHSSSMDFREDFYRPVKESSISDEHSVVFPHEDEGLFDSREFFREKCDLVVAEVSEASTGAGIELGWADEKSVPILCIHREEGNPSSAIKAVMENIVSYSRPEEIPEIIEEKIKEIKI